eukprot:2092421-Alexandrium_andersonii.AAC.1
MCIRDRLWPCFPQSRCVLVGALGRQEIIAALWRACDMEAASKPQYLFLYALGNSWTAPLPGCLLHRVVFLSVGP